MKLSELNLALPEKLNNLFEKAFSLCEKEYGEAPDIHLDFSGKEIRQVSLTVGLGGQEGVAAFFPVKYGEPWGSVYDAAGNGHMLPDDVTAENFLEKLAETIREMREGK